MTQKNPQLHEVILDLLFLLVQQRENETTTMKYTPLKRKRETQTDTHFLRKWKCIQYKNEKIQQKKITLNEKNESRKIRKCRNNNL